MPIIEQGQARTLHLAISQAVTVTPSVGGRATISSQSPRGVFLPQQTIVAAQTFGPYLSDTDLTIAASAGAAVYSLGAVSLVDAGGNPVSVGGGSTAIDFNAAVPFSLNSADMGIKYVTGPIQFTVNTVGATRGNLTTVTVVGNGTNTPTFDVNFSAHGTNAGFLSTSGIVNTLTMWYDGLKYYYSWSQEAVPVAVGAADIAAPTFSSALVSDALRTVIAVSMSEALAAITPATSAFTASGGKSVSTNHGSR